MPGGTADAQKQPGVHLARRPAIASLETGRTRFESELPRIVPDDANVAAVESVRGLGLYVQRQRHPGGSVPPSCRQAYPGLHLTTMDAAYAGIG